MKKRSQKGERLVAIADLQNLPRLADRHEPTKNQVALLNAALDPEVGTTLQNWCDKAGVDRQLWYKWNETPTFRAWWDKNFKKGMERNINYLDKIGLEKAKAGDFRFWEAMQKKYSDLEKRYEEKGNKNTFVFNVPRPEQKREVIDGDD